MQSTCSYVAVKDGVWLCQLSGDGVVVAQYTDGTIIMTRTQWDKNLPYYPIYKGDILEEFKIIHGNSETPFVWDTWIYDPEAGTEKTLMETAGLDINNAIEGGYRFLLNYDDKIESIAIFTDGIDQVEGMDWKDVVVNLMSFKSTKGSFLKRRMISELKKLEKAGHKNVDDIAGAVVRYER